MIAYVTLSGYRYDEYLPHVFRTTDAGTSWVDISSDLPEAPVNDIIVDPDISEKLYVGTDVGVFYTDSLGVSWDYLGTGMPNSPVTDLVLHNPTRTLIAATYGRSMYSIDLTIITKNENENLSIEDFVLYQNYPNPFNPTTKIKFTIPGSPLLGGDGTGGLVTLKVYDVLGNEIATLVNEEKPAGTYEVEFSAEDGYASGVYFYQLKATPGGGQAGSFVETKKMLLLK
jgi:hypothetical protein